MKLLSGILILIVAHFYPHSDIEIKIVNSLQLTGSVTGKVVLAQKNSTIRSGGRLYGRPSSSSSRKAVTDSVLIVITGSMSNPVLNSKSDQILNQKDQKFTPGLLAVKQNESIKIINSDPVYHNVFSLSNTKKFDVGRRPKGEHYTVTFDKPGVVDVFCDIHSNMHAVIHVLPPNAVAWTKVKSGDSFRFAEIPVGNYQLTVYALGYQEAFVNIDVSSGDENQVGTITLNS